MIDMLEQNGLTGDEFAPLVLDAVERGEYWIFPQPEALEPTFSNRNQAIVERKTPQFFVTD